MCEVDPQGFLLAEGVRHMAVAALTPINTAPVNSELPSPTLQLGGPYHQQTCVCNVCCSGGLKDLRGMAAIGCCGQSPASSSQ